MVPLWYAVVAAFLAYFLGSAMTWMITRRRKVVEVDRTEKKEVRPLNVFDAYSDKEMIELRAEAARQVKTYHKYSNSTSLLRDQVNVLRKIDDEGTTVCIGRSVPKWDTSREEKQKALAQVISNSFYAMEAGEDPTLEQEREPNAGDMQLAFDILRKFDIEEK